MVMIHPIPEKTMKLNATEKLALLEENGFLGGTATGGLVLPISGFFHKEGPA